MFAGLLAARPAAAGVGSEAPGSTPYSLPDLVHTQAPSGHPVVTPRSDSITEIPASVFGFSPAALESPAFGPDLLAVGPNGAIALWDPVRRTVFGVSAAQAFVFPVDHADSLAWTTSGDLVVLDESARVLTRWAPLPTAAGASHVARLAMDRLCPVGVRLAVWGDLAVGVDAFGNAHPLADLAAGLAPATGPRVLAPSHLVRVDAGELTVDGRRIDVASASLGAPALGARLLDDWLLIEAGERGAVRARFVISLSTGRQVDLPLGGRYRPAVGVSVGPDGVLGYLNTASASLVVVQVAP